MKNVKGIMKRLAVSLIILIVFFVSAPAWAEGTVATQGSVALNLAAIMGLNLPAGATGQDAINALSAHGINPATGWNAGAAADSNFISALYSAVQAAFNAGRIPSTGGLTSPAGMVAAACTEAGIPQSEAVDAIRSAGGDSGEATQGATYGGAYIGAGAYIGGGGGASSYGPGFDGSRPGSGGGGGGVNPSPNN